MNEDIMMCKSAFRSYYRYLTSIQNVFTDFLISMLLYLVHISLIPSYSYLNRATIANIFVLEVVMIRIPEFYIHDVCHHVHIYIQDLTSFRALIGNNTLSIEKVLPCINITLTISMSVLFQSFQSI